MIARYRESGPGCSIRPPRVLPSVNVLVRDAVVTQARAAGRGRLDRIRWTAPEAAHMPPRVSDGADRGERGDIAAAGVPQLPFDRIGFAGLAGVDGRRGR